MSCKSGNPATRMAAVRNADHAFRDILNAFPVTVRLLPIIASTAISGFSKPIAARGSATAL